MRRQGATIAVVGVSQGTIEVAERLSHTDRGVKVFLAHYEEGSSARLNGFAGVFDLRAEAKRLAAAIKSTVSNTELPTFPATPFARSDPSLLARFVELQKKVGNPGALSDGILEHLMSLAGATEGFLLQPEKLDETTFRVTANRGENVPPIGQSIPLDPSGISSADTFAAEDLDALEVTLADRDHFALPIQNRDQLCAVLVCDKIDRSEAFDHFLEAMSYLFDQLAEREEKSLRHQLIAIARSSFVDQVGWLLLDGDGRVIHREGLGISFFKLSRNRIKEPRLQDIIYRSFHGEASPIELQGRKISAHTIISDQGLFCLVEIHLQVGAVDGNSLQSNNSICALNLIRSSCINTENENVLLDELLDGLVGARCVDTNLVSNGLEKVSVKADFDGKEIQATLVAGFGLVLLMASKEIPVPISTTIELAQGQWILTAEISEKELGTEAFDWKNLPLTRAALDLAGFDRRRLRTSIFGFQLIGLSERIGAPRILHS